VSLYTKLMYDKIKWLKYAAILLIMSKLWDLPFELLNPTAWLVSMWLIRQNGSDFVTIPINSAGKIWNFEPRKLCFPFMGIKLKDWCQLWVEAFLNRSAIMIMWSSVHISGNQSNKQWWQGSTVICIRL
jgi:hypothetical protein